MRRLGVVLAVAWFAPLLACASSDEPLYTAQADGGLAATIDITVTPTSDDVTVSRPSDARDVHEWFGSREDGKAWLAGL